MRHCLEVCTEESQLLPVFVIQQALIGLVVQQLSHQHNLSLLDATDIPCIHHDIQVLQLDGQQV